MTVPIKSTFLIRGHGRAEGPLRADVEYTFSFAIEYEAELAQVESPLHQYNEFDDYGRPAFPEQDAAIQAVLKQLNVAYTTPWTTTYQFAAAEVARIREAVAVLLAAPTISRATESYVALLGPGPLQRAHIFLLDPHDTTPHYELLAYYAEAERPQLIELLAPLLPPGVTPPVDQDSLRWSLPLGVDVVKLRGDLRKHLPLT